MKVNDRVENSKDLEADDAAVDDGVEADLLVKEEELGADKVVDDMDVEADVAAI